MKVTDEELMAYADGELSHADAARVEGALAADAGLAEKLAAHRRLHAALQGHLDPVAQEPVPDALTAMIVAARKEDEAGKVVSLAAARAGREAKAPPRPFLQRWGGLAIAASLVLGVMLGTQMQSGGAIVERNGALLASGPLAKGLDTQLASTEGGSVRILTSFQRDGGGYCRVFEAASTAGIACKDQTGWVLERIMSSGTRQASDYRQAGSADSELMSAAQDMAKGEPLDAGQEKAAVVKGWR